MKICIRRPFSPANQADPAMGSESPAGIGRLASLLNFAASEPPVASASCPLPLSPSANLAAFLGRPLDKVNNTQIREIIRRLKVRLAEAANEAQALQLAFDVVLVHEVIDHLLVETRSPAHIPFNDGSIRAYFVEGLFHDLLQSPSNIFEIVIAADGTENYLPLTPETWAICLTKLKQSLTPAANKS